MQGGHRIGITGNVVVKEGKVVNINYISSLNFRIAKQIIGCSNKILKYMMNTEEGSLYNTLIVSPPGAGKTTILRDSIRQISSGYQKTVGVVDERGEIAAMYRGIPQNDVGERTDILDNIPKAIGMQMLIRSMAPEVIVADEIGSIEDVETICYAVCSGIKGIFTAHGGSLEDLKINPAIHKLIDSYVIEKIIVLSNHPKKPKGEIEMVYELNKLDKNYITSFL